MKAATAVMNAEFERSDKIRENEAAKELAKLKEDLETKVVKELANLKAELRNNAAGEIKRLRGGTIAKNNNALEHQQAQHNKNYKNRMKANTENFKEFMDKWSVTVTANSY
jgi:flagellar motor switch protein FliG